jgi:L-aminopeptidase/D-esterase-like protein
MDPLKYVAGKSTGESKVLDHANNVVLISCPGGFDATTGAKLPPQEMGILKHDLLALWHASAQGVKAAHAAVEMAERRHAATTELLKDCGAEFPE